MLKLKKSGFTLVEVILACSMFAIVVSWIVLAINRSYTFMNNTKLAVRASNFAREWMEIMYNIRDTSWRENSWWRNNLRSYIGTGDIRSDGTSQYLFTRWIYVLKEERINDGWIGNTHFYANHNNSWDDSCYSDDWFWSDSCDALRNQAKIKFCVNGGGNCKDRKYSYYDEDGTKKEWNVQDVLIWDWLEFYSIVRVYGIFCKNSSVSDDTTSCSNASDPKEMRFCVKVFYRWNWQHSSELCGIMTNFME